MRTVYERRPDIDSLPSRKRETFPDLAQEEEFWTLFEQSRRYSMVHVTGFFNVYSALKYVLGNDVRGDFVECGVWMGGVSIFAGLFLAKRHATERTVHLYDTFEGFPKGSSDVVLGKKVAGPTYANFRQGVEQNLRDEGVSAYRIIEGPIEETLLSDPTPPEAISVLRLDTDFYSSTRAELDHLYPRLSVGGVLIVDDYGYYEGSRRACDEYFGDRMLWNRIDRGIRCGVRLS